MSEDTKLVAQANENFYRAFESLDIKQMEKVWAKENPIQCGHPGWRILRGWNVVMESWRRIFENTPMIRFLLTDVAIEIRGNMAWVTLYENLNSSVEGQNIWGMVDILINNAGWGKRAPVLRGKLEDWDQTFRLNLRAPMLLAKLLLPNMIAKGEGAIINIGSVSGKTGEANGAAYSASKFGLIGFTQSLYEEVREEGIKVAVILPGFVDKPLIQSSQGF